MEEEGRRKQSKFWWTYSMRLKAMWFCIYLRNQKLKVRKFQTQIVLFSILPSNEGQATKIELRTRKFSFESYWPTLQASSSLIIYYFDIFCFVFSGGNSGFDWSHNNPTSSPCTRKWRRRIRWWRKQHERRTLYRSSW